MPEIFFISDTHFGHSNILTFKKKDGELCRPEFEDVNEMDEYMVKQWNSVVRPQDKIYHLGDIVMHQRNLPIIGRLQGHKRLVRGNHDNDIKTLKLMEYFDEIYGVRVFRNHDIICSHIPLDYDSIERFGVNVHGHLHNNHDKGYPWINISVEMLPEKYTPIPLYLLKEVIAKYKRELEEDGVSSLLEERC